MSAEPQTVPGSWRAAPLKLVPALLMLAAVAALAPARLKLIGLYPAAMGAAAGYLVAWFLRGRGGSQVRRVVAVAAVLVPLTLVSYAAGSFLVWRQARAKEVAANLLAQPGGGEILERIRSGKRPANQLEAEFLAAYRDRMNPPPGAYLVDRLHGLPVNVSKAWAVVIPATEFAFAWVAGIVAAALAAKRGGGPATAVVESRE